jgi:excisionase family DNA binding protein
MSRSKPNASTQHFVMRSVGEAAKEIGIPEETIHGWIDQGHLPAQQIGRTTLVNLLAVQSLSLRPPGERFPPDRDWSRYYRRDRPWLWVLGGANVFAGVTGLAVFVGLGPGGLRAAWWLVLCLLSVAVGAVEIGGLPFLRNKGR